MKHPILTLILLSLLLLLFIIITINIIIIIIIIISYIFTTFSGPYDYGREIICRPYFCVNKVSFPDFPELQIPPLATNIFCCFQEVVFFLLISISLVFLRWHQEKGNFFLGCVQSNRFLFLRCCLEASFSLLFVQEPLH